MGLAPLWGEEGRPDPHPPQGTRGLRVWCGADLLEFSLYQNPLQSLYEGMTLPLPSGVVRCPAVMLETRCILGGHLWKQLLSLLPEVFFYSLSQEHMQLRVEQFRCPVLFSSPVVAPKETQTNQIWYHKPSCQPNVLALPPWSIRQAQPCLNSRWSSKWMPWECNPFTEWILRYKQKRNFTFPATNLVNLDCRILLSLPLDELSGLPQIFIQLQLR